MAKNTDRQTPPPDWSRLVTGPLWQCANIYTVNPWIKSTLCLRWWNFCCSSLKDFFWPARTKELIINAFQKCLSKCTTGQCWTDTVVLRISEVFTHSCQYTLISQSNLWRNITQDNTQYFSSILLVKIDAFFLFMMKRCSKHRKKLHLHKSWRLQQVVTDLVQIIPTAGR